MKGVTITAEQVRAARSALGLSVTELSSRSGVGTATIKRYEAVTGLPKSRKDNLGLLRQAFEAAGIEFIGALGDAPGIRIHGGGSGS